MLHNTTISLSTVPLVQSRSSKKPISTMPSSSLVIAICGLCAATIAVQLFPSLDHSNSMEVPQAPLFDGGAIHTHVELLLAATVAFFFFTAVTFIYVRIHKAGGGGAGAGDENRRISRTVFFTLCVSVGLLQLFPQFDVLELEAAFQAVLPFAAMAALLTAVTYINFHIHNGGGGGGDGDGRVSNRRIPEVAIFVLSVSVGLLELFLFPLPGDKQDDGAKAPSLGEAAVNLLLPGATMTFFLSTTLIFVHIRKGSGGRGDDDAGNEPILADVGPLAKLTLGAALVTVVLSFMAIVLPLQINK